MLLVPVILLIITGITLLLHHGCKHAADDPATSTAQRESCAAVCYFQPKDIAHFETWILVCLTNGASLAATSSGRSSPAALASIVLLTVAAFLALMLIISHLVFWAATERRCERREHLLPTICEEGKSNEGTVSQSNEKLNWLHTLLHNVSNHETWILVCFTNAVSLAVV
jgi:hypothetical protein